MCRGAVGTAAGGDELRTFLIPSRPDMLAAVDDQRGGCEVCSSRAVGSAIGAAGCFRGVSCRVWAAERRKVVACLESLVIGSGLSVSRWAVWLFGGARGPTCPLLPERLPFFPLAAVCRPTCSCRQPRNASAEASASEPMSTHPAPTRQPALCTLSVTFFKLYSNSRHHCEQGHGQSTTQLPQHAPAQTVARNGLLLVDSTALQTLSISGSKTSRHHVAIHPRNGTRWPPSQPETRRIWSTHTCKPLP